MAKKLKFTVEKKFSKQRLDKYLGEKLALEFSRTNIKKFIKNDQIFLNGGLVKPSERVRENDEILVNIEDPVLPEKYPPLEMPLDIIYEDNYLMVINKPAGIVVHPALGHFSDTLVNALIAYRQKLSSVNGLARPGIVHRLDKDTSGILVVAKDNKTHINLAKQFKQHTIKRVYIGVVAGRMEYDEGIIDAPISRSPFNRKKMAVLSSFSRGATTQYRVIKRSEKISVLEIYPQTGRTHQIRVHLAHIGHPVIGDKCYGRGNKSSRISRQALHAKGLGFIHPVTNKFMSFEASLPPDMLAFISEVK